MTTHDNIIATLTDALSPTTLALENESHMHSGFVEGKESHFKLVIVSNAFDGLRLIQRHQKIYALLANMLTSGGGSVHALAIHAYTPTEWDAQQEAPNSPLCANKSL